MLFFGIDLNVLYFSPVQYIAETLVFSLQITVHLTKFSDLLCEY